MPLEDRFWMHHGRALTGDWPLTLESSAAPDSNSTPVPRFIPPTDWRILAEFGSFLRKFKSGLTKERQAFRIK
jgi:hypothetical protein